MKEENNSYIGFALFFFLIVVIVAFGTFVIFLNKSEVSNSNDTEKVLLNDKIKKDKDKDKDYIFYDSEEVISDDYSLTLKRANININTEDAHEVNETLDNVYMQALKEMKKANSQDRICENNSDLYSASILDYATYYYDKYITLLVTENGFSCQEDIERPLKVYSYTFDGTTGKLLNINDLLKNFDLTYTEVIEKIENSLNNNQTVIDDTPQIQIEETLNKLKENENYTIYISETNKLVVKYIVKTNSIDYNDIIELN